MARYLLRRVAQMAFVLWAAFTIAFVVLFLLPGDPVLTMLGAEGDAGHIDPQRIEELRVRFGLDQPLPIQYLSMLADTVRGDLGTSMRTGQPVLSMIIHALPSTGLLAASALGVGIMAGATIAYAASYTKRPALREALLALPPIGVSLPTFWIGLLLLQVVSFQLGLLPAIGTGGWRTLLLPTLTLALPMTAIMAQVFAKSLQESLGQPYIATAMSKGAKWSRVLNRHALRNAAITMVTVVGVLVGELLSGAVVVEIVFARPGIGRLTVTAVQAQDIPVVLGVVLLGAVIYAVLNLLVDLVYPLLDPRIVHRPSNRRTKEVTA